VTSWRLLSEQSVRGTPGFRPMGRDVEDRELLMFVSGSPAERAGRRRTRAEIEAEA
jgi:hypothetical protein